MTTKQPDFAELNALAIEACDMWQEHLATFAKDPTVRAELTRYLEPQRRLFADWAAMMQKGSSMGGNHEQHSAQDQRPDRGTSEQQTSSGGVQHDGDTLSVAELAERVAELEKRIADLEERAFAKAG